ncbi:MAG TPA: UrcA family protein [Allosphingosinicella sp.]|jgi:UrcA family protein
MHNPVPFAAAILVASLAAPAYGQAEDMSVSVSLAGLDLGQARDRGRLDARLERAAHQVCDTESAHAAAEQQRNIACRAGALASARQDLADAMARGVRQVSLVVRAGAAGGNGG